MPHNSRKALGFGSPNRLHSPALRLTGTLTPSTSRHAVTNVVNQRLKLGLSRHNPAPSRHKEECHSKVWKTRYTATTLIIN
jgi:hypothetical protein